MIIKESLITEQNQYDLFYNILLSVKSKNPNVTMYVDEKNKCKLDVGSISISNSVDFYSYSIKVEREEVPRLFSKNSHKYNFYIEGSNRGGYSSSNTRLNFKSEMLSNRCQDVISQIFNYLYNIEEQRKIEETNNNITNIISDISTTVDVAYKRDNKIEEVLNNN